MDTGEAPLVHPHAAPWIQCASALVQMLLCVQRLSLDVQLSQPGDTDTWTRMVLHALTQLQSQSCQPGAAQDRASAGQAIRAAALICCQVRRPTLPLLNYMCQRNCSGDVPSH